MTADRTILSNKYFSISLNQFFVFRFFQQLFEAEGETVGLVFFNLDAIEKYRNELLSVRVAGIDGTFKTVPKRPSQLTNGCLLTFHVLFHNVVSNAFNLIVLFF